MPSVKADGPKTVEVTLSGDHTHVGKIYKAGAKIKVTEKQRDWLIERDKVAGKTGDSASGAK